MEARRRRQRDFALSQPRADHSLHQEFSFWRIAGFPAGIRNEKWGMADRNVGVTIGEVSQNAGRMHQESYLYES